MLSQCFQAQDKLCCLGFATLVLPMAVRVYIEVLHVDSGP